MQRILLGVVWFFVIWFVARVIFGGIVGGIAGGQSGSPGGGFSSGQVAALEFFRHYGTAVAVVSLALAAAGTLTGFLPGTRKTASRVVAREPERGGVWPPPPTGPGAA